MSVQICSIGSFTKQTWPILSLNGCCIQVLTASVTENCYFVDYDADHDWFLEEGGEGGFEFKIGSNDN